jgi:hypothetical protein
LHDPIEVRYEVRVVLDSVPVLDWVPSREANIGNSVLEHDKVLFGDVLPTGSRLIEVDETAVLGLFRMN